MLTLLIIQNLYSQDIDLSKKISEIEKIKAVPFVIDSQMCNDCGDRRIWEIVRGGRKSIPMLLNKISDTTISQIVYHEFTDSIRLRVGDIAYIILEQISFIPTYKITDLEFDVMVHCGYQMGFFDYLGSYKSRLKFQKQLKNYFKTTKLKFDKNIDLYFRDCFLANGISGKYSE
jgi:hypothetical protein